MLYILINLICINMYNYRLLFIMVLFLVSIKLCYTQQNFCPLMDLSAPSECPLLHWEEIKGATVYNVQFSTHSSFSNPHININTSKNEYQVGIHERLTFGIVYYVRVRAGNDSIPFPTYCSHASFVVMVSCNR